MAHYVREAKVLRLEEAVRKMTSLPAQRFKLKDRGMIREGAIADLVVFDDRQISEEVSYAAPRKYCSQMRYVLLGGEIAVADGKATSRYTGQVIRQ